MINFIQCDDFAPDALEVRNRVIASSTFTTKKGPDGADYTGICDEDYPAEWFDRISYIMGQQIEPKLTCFRLNLKGELPHNWVHSDGNCSKWASILYLNPPHQCYGGTAFWKHTGLHMDHMPSEEEIKQTGLDVEWFCGMMTKEWGDLRFWEQAGFVDMKFNRFITYPTSFFHSRYPFEGFGTGPADGRLIWVCFYDLK